MKLNNLVIKLFSNIIYKLSKKVTYKLTFNLLTSYCPDLAIYFILILMLVMSILNL